MAISFVASANGSTSGYAASPGTLAAVPCGTAPNTIIVGFIYTYSSVSNSIGTMTVDGSSAGVTAQAVESHAANSYGRLFFWMGTGPGNVDITFPWTGDVSLSSFGVCVWSGVDALGNYAATVGVTTNAPSVVVTCDAASDLAVGVWGHDQTSVTATANGTERLDAGSGYRLVVFEEPGSTPTATVDGTFSSTTYAPVVFRFALSEAVGGAAAPKNSSRLMLGVG